MAQGLALALDRPVVPVSTLAVLAQGAVAAALPVLALIDARMGEVYAGAFMPGDDGCVRPLGDEAVLAPTAVAAGAPAMRFNSRESAASRV